MRRLLPLLLLSPTLAVAQDDLVNRLGALPHVSSVRVLRANLYEILFEQPVDHTKPKGVKFTQHIFLVNKGLDKPVVLGTEGYQASGPAPSELVKTLGNANQLTVEHRYFGNSMPKEVDWKQLTVKNAAEDMHEVVTSFRKLYTGKWVATGVSKGGQTALFFKCFFPDDVDATVAYVAPVNVAQEDPRINLWMQKVGSDETRAMVKSFQATLLKRKSEVLPLLGAKPADYSMGVEKAYEFGVLEFPYAFWQFGANREPLPGPDAPAADLAKAYKKVNSMYWYCDDAIKQFQAFYYQAFTEIGYYNYDISDFKDYLTANPRPTNQELCPPETQGHIVYNPATLAFVFNTLQYKADRVVYIYGETDAWSATQMHLLGRTDAVKIVVPGAWHNASIRLATPEQKAQVYDALDRWLGFKVTRG